MKDRGMDSFYTLVAPRSKGGCELCNTHTICYDIHHSGIPDKPKAVKLNRELNREEREKLKQIAKEYEQQNKLEELHRKELQLQIDKLVKEQGDSCNKNLFKLLYKPEYGEYDEFVRNLAEELRNTDEDSDESV